MEFPNRPDRVQVTQEVQRALAADFDMEPRGEVEVKGKENIAAYLDELAGIFASCRRLMNPGAKVVVEVANLKDEHGVTTLAWELALALRRVLRFEGEVVVDWDRYDYGYDHSYCLVFRAPDVD